MSTKPTSVRATVSLPRDIHQTLGALARQKKVSMAWVMRDAAERYVAEQWPLFGKGP
jgi:predicted transcriptional regulator